MKVENYTEYTVNECELTRWLCYGHRINKRQNCTLLKKKTERNLDKWTAGKQTFLILKKRKKKVFNDFYWWFVIFHKFRIILCSSADFFICTDTGVITARTQFNRNERNMMIFLYNLRYCSFPEPSDVILKLFVKGRIKMIKFFFCLFCSYTCYRWFRWVHL